MSILQPAEEEIFNKQAYYKKDKITLILSNVRLIIVKKKSIIKDMNYHLIEKIKYTKKDEPNPNEKTEAKFRIIDIEENKLDITFKGESSPDDLNEAIQILKSKKAEASNENRYDDDNSSHSSKSKNETEFSGYLFQRAEPPNEKKLKAMILTQNPAALSMYEMLNEKQIKPNIISDEDFWVNFKEPLAKKLSYEAYQQNGYSGRFLSEVSADSKSRGNQFSFTLDDNIKRQIMRKKPRIADKYVQFMREKEKTMGQDEADKFFWQQYFSAQLLDSNHIKDRKEKDKTNIFDGVNLKDSVSFNENSRHFRSKFLSLPVKVGPFYDSINPADQYSGCCGQGVFNKELLPHTFQPTVDAYNIHAEIALIDSGILMDTTRSVDEEKTAVEAPIAVRPELEDLMPSEKTVPNGLCLTKTITKPPMQKIDSGEFRIEARRFADRLIAFDDSFTRFAEPPQPQMKEAVVILRDMTGDQGNLFNYQKINSQRSPLFSSLREVRKLKEKEQILLFTFWNTYLNSKDQNKILRVKDEIEEFRNMVVNEKRKIVKDDMALPPLYEEMEESLNRVIDMFNKPSHDEQQDDNQSSNIDFAFF